MLLIDLFCREKCRLEFVGAKGDPSMEIDLLASSIKFRSAIGKEDLKFLSDLRVFLTKTAKILLRGR